jgi:hypothetical protein
MRIRRTSLPSCARCQVSPAKSVSPDVIQKTEGLIDAIDQAVAKKAGGA